MKRLMMLGAAAIACVAVVSAEAMSLADARAQIQDAVSSPAKTAELMSQLEAADQVALLGELNAAIDAMPGSAEEKAAKFVDVNEAALKSAKKGNLKSMVAETFATVPLEALTVVNERFAQDLFNRAADPSINDEEFVKRAVETMEAVNARTASSDTSGERSTFAILTFLRASNGQPADLLDKLVETLPDASTRQIAKTEWIPPAMATGADKTYEPLLGTSFTIKEPDYEIVLSLIGPSAMAGMLGDLGTSGGQSYVDASYSIDALGLPEQTQTADFRDPPTPYTSDSTQKYFGGYKRGEPSGYQLQSY